MQGLDTESPQLVNSRGVCLVGQYEESLGSLLFFLLQKQRQDAVGLTAASAQQQPNGALNGGVAVAALPMQQPTAQPSGTAAAQGPAPAAAMGGSSLQGPTHTAGSSKPPKSGAVAASGGSRAMFLSHTDTVLRFRKAQ